MKRSIEAILGILRIFTKDGNHKAGQQTIKKNSVFLFKAKRFSRLLLHEKDP